MNTTMIPFRLITSVLVVSLVSAVSASAQQTAEELYQAGLYQEEVQGNLERAIDIYERNLEEFPNNRPVAAKALMHIGLCHEKLGSREAQRAYSRLLREYGDQTEVAGQARARLAVLGGLAQAEGKKAPAGPVARLLLKDDGGCYVYGMRPSPDGTRLAYSDFCSTGDVFVRDLESGETERVATGWHLGAVWSTDGKQLAVGDMSAARSPLKLIDLESGAVETPAALEGLWFLPRDWSSDGERLSGTITHEDQTVSSAVVSLRTGEVITLASGVKMGTDGSAFSPDGRYAAYSDLVDGDQDIYVMALGTGERHRVTTGPGAERVALWSPDGEMLGYGNRGGFWVIRMANGRPEGQPRVVGKRLGMASAWTVNGFYYAVDKSFVQTYRVPVDPGTAEAIGSPEAFPDVEARLWIEWAPNMKHIASSGWGDMKHIYVTRDRSVTAFPIGDEIMTSSLWWSGDGDEILFTTAARGTRDKRKTVWALDPSDGAVRQLFPKQDSIHHIHVSPDGARMVFLRETESEAVVQLRVSDLGDPEGLVLASGSDSDPEGRLSMMYGQPRFSPDGTRILFLRQKTSQEGDHTAGLWVVPSDGSEPPSLLATAGLIHRPIWDPSGRFIAFRELDSEWETSTLYVVSLDTRAKHEILPKSDLRNDVQPRTWSPDGRWIAISQKKGGLEYWVTEDPLSEDAPSP